MDIVENCRYGAEVFAYVVPIFTISSYLKQVHYLSDLIKFQPYFCELNNSFVSLLFFYIENRKQICTWHTHMYANAS